MNILVKFPIRGRKQRFFDTLGKWRGLESGEHVVQYVVTLDSDDTAMHSEATASALNLFDRLGYRYAMHASKVEACNADMDLADDGWEVLVLASDDMVPQVKGWDARMAGDLEREFPDTDGCLWYFDGYCKVVCTLSVMGRKWYDRFGYVYNPEYRSLWCDNEHTEVARRAGKLWYSPDVLVKHCHPYHGGGPKDELLKRNEAFFQADKAVYERRQKAGFP